MKDLRIILTTIILSLFINSFALNAQEQATDISGSWIGSLKVGAVELRLVFNITKENDGEYSATMDSPDQGANGIPTAEVSFSNDSLRIEVPATRGFYAGRFTDNSEFEGVWSQMGQVLKLDLSRKEEDVLINRPQEPKPPYPYMEEDIIFQNIKASISLAGTITYPDKDSLYPAVILISGSGPQNRDEAIMGHKPFKVIADYLSRNGIVVLRYDDRGVGESMGTQAGATSADFAGDARAAYVYASTLDYVDHDKIGIIGHSEGGLIAFIMAAKYDDISFIVSLAGPGVDGRTIIEDQTAYMSRLSNIPEDIINENSKINNMIYDIITETENLQDGIVKIKKFVTEYYSGQGFQDADIQEIINNLSLTINETSYNWLYYFFNAKPREMFPLINCPVLALNGSKDCQVLAERNIDAIIAGFAETENRQINAKVLPGLNHLFQHCETGLVAEYSKIEETMSQEVLKIIAEWIIALK